MRSQRNAALFLRDQSWIVPDLGQLLLVHRTYTKGTKVDRTGQDGWRNETVEISGLIRRMSLTFRDSRITKQILEALLIEANRRVAFLGRKFGVDFKDGPNITASLLLNDEYVLRSLEIMSITALAIMFTQPFGDCNKGTSALIVDHLADYLFGQPMIPETEPNFDPIVDVKAPNFDINLGGKKKTTRYGEVMRKTWEVRVNRNLWNLEEMAKAVLTPLRAYYPSIKLLPQEIEGKDANAIMSLLDQAIN